MSVTGEKSEIDMTIAIDETVCSDALKAELTRSGFSYVIFASASDIPETTGLILVSADFPLRNLADRFSAKHNFLIFVVADNNELAIDNVILDSVEAVLPANPRLLVHQLSRIIKLYLQNYHLLAAVDTLEADSARQKRKASEIELLKNAIVRNVSHELRTPLLQVKSAVALIGEDSSDKKLINYAQNAVSRLETHVKNITMLGHSLDVNISPIILRDAVVYAKRNLTRIWTRRTDADRIHIKIEDHLPPILTDKQGLSTVLQLLMDNALKFGADKDIEIIGRKSGDKVYVAIRDRGIGIAQDKLQDIFESFYQVDDTSTRPYGGAGVGLALVKFILENQQVKIHVDSTLNEGSTFWFELPYVNFDEIE